MKRLLPAGPAATPSSLVGGSGWAWILLVSALAGAILWPGRAGLPPIDRDESRYAQATRQMLESGDLLAPHFQDQPRYVQPVGAYWLQAVAVALAGDPQVRAIWPHRIPSLIAGVLAVAFTAAIGLRLFAAPVACAGAALLAASLLFNFEARIATTDATLLACIVAGQYGLLRVWQAREAAQGCALSAALFWVALGCSIMVKGPAGALVLGSTLLALAATQGRWRWIARLRPHWGLPLMLAIVLPWMIAIGLRTSGEFFTQAVGHNLLGKMSQAQESHGAPPGTYLLLFLLTFWPGSLLMVQAVPGVWANRRLEPIRYLLCWSVPSWVVFECLPTKLPHYVLPTYPALALLAVARLPAPTVLNWQRLMFGAAALGWLFIGAALAVGPAALSWWLGNGIDAVGVAAGLLTIGLFSWSLRSAWNRRPLKAAVFGIAAAVVVNASMFGRLLPGLAPIWLSPRVARLVHAVRPCPDSVVISGNYSEPSLVFLLGTSTRLADPITAANALIKDPDCSLALIGNQGLAAFDEVLASRNIRAHELGSVAGFDYSNGRRLDLHLFRLELPHLR